MRGFKEQDIDLLIRRGTCWDCGASPSSLIRHSLDRYRCRSCSEEFKEKQAECVHRDNKNGICLDCGIDTTVAMHELAEFRRECREDR